MSVSDSDIAFAQELFEQLSELSTRKMMGGLCLYHDGTIFSMLHSDGSVWLKARGDMADALTQAGWKHWTYSRDGKKATAMPYWQLPPEVLDDPDLACNWARRTLAELTQ